MDAAARLVELREPGADLSAIASAATWGMLAFDVLEDGGGKVAEDANVFADKIGYRSRYREAAIGTRQDRFDLKRNLLRRAKAIAADHEARVGSEDENVLVLVALLDFLDAGSHDAPLVEELWEDRLNVR